uniref:Cag1 n=1 Tax=Helicobacter pylori TaxID=210 RepID=A4GMT3_HELPX|nr:Cag1 [Helicobacter pylori 908]
MADTINTAMRVLNASKHYTATGVREPDACTKSFKKSAMVSYDLALGYLVSQNKPYGLKAIEILNAWANELQSVDTYQSEDNINFYMPYMNMAYWFVKKEFPSPEYEDFIRRMRQYSQSALNTNHGAWGILYFYLTLVKLIEKLFKKQSKVATTVNNETQKSQATSVTNEPTEAKESKD